MKGRIGYLMRVRFQSKLYYFFGWNIQRYWTNLSGMNFWGIIYLSVGLLHSPDMVMFIENVISHVGDIHET